MRRRSFRNRRCRRAEAQVEHVGAHVDRNLESSVDVGQGADADQLAALSVARRGQHPDWEQHGSTGDSRRKAPTVRSDDSAYMAPVANLVAGREIITVAVANEANVAEV